MIIIDNFYKINILQFEAKEDILVFKIKYDMKQYSDFKNYCSDNFLHKKRILLGWNKEKYNVIFEKASFVLGRIDYNENGEVKFLNSEANGILEFRIVD